MKQSLTATLVLLVCGGCITPRPQSQSTFAHEDFDPGLSPKDRLQAEYIRSFHLTYIIRDLTIEAPNLVEAVKQLKDSGMELQNGAQAGGYFIRDVSKNARPVRVQTRKANVLWAVEQICAHTGYRFMVGTHAIILYRRLEDRDG